MTNTSYLLFIPYLYLRDQKKTIKFKSFFKTELGKVDFTINRGPLYMYYYLIW